MLNNKNEMYDEPLDILNDLSACDKAEMTREGLAFLCGLIKKNRPRKIVEIGVAAGGTTAVILNCASMLGLDTKVFSVDLLENYYLDTNKKVGYLAQECKTMLKRIPDHTLYTGKYAVENIEMIDKDIDLLILDTVHSMPGEILDFLAYFPYLKQGSIVVLHDITLNHYGSDPYSYVTKVLFDVVTADKIINLEINNGCPDIAALVINEHTGQYIEDVFSALTLTWKYMPGERELLLYRNWYSKYYELNCLNLYDMAVTLNKKSFYKIKNLERKKFVRIYHSLIKCIQKKVYVYGCGNFGKQFYHILEQCGMELGGYIVSDGQRVDEIDHKIYFLSDIKLDREKDIVFVGVNVSLYNVICNQLKEKGINYILPDKYMFEFLD